MRNTVTTLTRSGLIIVLLTFAAGLFVLEASLPLTGQVNPTGVNQALSLPQFGVTIQVPPGWTHVQDANVHGLVNLPQAKIKGANFDQTASISIGVLRRNSHAAAVERLLQIRGESTTPVTFLVIAGWPALERQTSIPLPQSGQAAEREGPETAKRLVLVTTAVAVGNTIFRLDGSHPAEWPNANEIAAQMKQIGRDLSFTQAGNPVQAALDLQKLQSSSAGTIPSGTARPGFKQKAGLTTQTNTEQPGLAKNTFLGGQGTEPEIAVSTSGKNIVIANAFSGVSSQDGGQTFSGAFNFPNSTGGDSSVAFGRSGNFYEATIGSTAACPAANPNCNNAQVMNVSIDGGKTFPAASSTNYFVCGTTNCGFGGVPDQEHIAADRFNAGPLPAAGDQVYSVWRRGKTSSSTAQYGLSCSSDSGANWTAPVFAGDGLADFPRITVGQDGAVYVVYLDGNNVELDRYSSCANGLTANANQGVVVTTATSPVVCPVAGLDRCNNGNDLRSAQIAVDDTNAKHIFVAYATADASASGVNENVMATDSYSSGDDTTWSTPTQVNNSILGRRYLPWVCSVGGNAYVSWYDRRNATATTNDVTDYFAVSAAPDAFGFLTPGTDFQINSPTTGDPQCASGWNNPNQAPRAPGDAESCFVQPQLAGYCGTASPSPANGDTQERCDFTGPDATVCSLKNTVTGAAETCQNGGGVPKYGDYNGNACVAGRLYTIWGSATAQPNTPPPAGINLFFSQKLVCCAPQIQVPGPVSLTACSGTTSTTTVNICNTGKTDLQIDAISSSSTKITVAQPTSGYPLIVSPDSCFPAQVSLSPGASTGAISGTLTISSNDTVNPSATVQVNGNSPPPSINATIANTGSYGNVCAGTQADLNLNVINQGQCSLTITNITSSSLANFTLPTISNNLPLTLGAGSDVNLPIRFQPIAFGSAGYVTCSNTTPQMATITITSNDPVTPNLTQPVSGIEGCPTLVLSPQKLNGIYAFPATVSDPTQTLGCYTDKQITMSNAGICPLIVPAGGLSASPSNYFSVVNPTSPLTIAPGASPVPVTVRFRPITTSGQLQFAPDQQLGSLSISSNDPVAADNTAGGSDGLCGEPTYHSGARVLVVNSSNNPVGSVAKITLSSKGLTPPFSQTLMPAPLLTAPNICGNTILYHLDNETLRPAGTTGNNPRASYVLSAKQSSTQANMSFTLGQCQMQQIILQVK